MTPFYFVVRAHGTENDVMDVQTRNLATKKDALDAAVARNKITGLTHYVVEVIAKVELPKAEPIVTMKGD